MTNEEKIRELLNEPCWKSEPYLVGMDKVGVEDVMERFAEWKDEQYMQDRSGFCNFLKEWAQEWLIEQLTAFAQHLNKRGAFRDDLCMDFEHEAQSFIEMQQHLKKQ